MSMALHDKPTKHWANVNRISAFKAAKDGFQTLWQQEFNFRLHLLITVFVLLLGVVFKLSPIEWCIIILLIGLVLLLEMINSAIENVVDLVVGTQWHELAKRSKDIAAAAVTLSALIAVIIGMIIFVPHLMAVFHAWIN
ncbi:diacylglycerol kinase family protein [Aerococcaceae bacterium zg-ZJ1578]|nr:diacylglycerol kinase family protein [Aerococcaceae bacterium zg-1578]